MKKVSIIIPIYNISEYIEECIISLCKQTYKKIEIILIDDGSTDNSGKICDEFEKKDKRIVVIHKENGGISDARNRGLDICTGEYIFFLDGDDYVEPNIIEILVSLLEKNSADISVVLKVGHHCITEELVIGNSEKMYQYLLDKSAVEMWGKLYKNKLFKDVRFPIGKIHEDAYVLPTVIFNAKKIVVYNKGFYHYRQRENSIMGELRKGNVKGLIECNLFGIEYIKQLSKKKSYILSIQKMHFYIILWYYLNIIRNITDDEKKKNANKEIARFYKKTMGLYLKNPKVRIRDKLRFIGIYIKNK